MLSPLSRRRLQRFRRHRLGWVSLWLFAGLLLLSLGAELVANDKPLLLGYKGELYVPALKRYTEQQFGGQLPFQPDYRSAYVRQLIAEQGGWMLFAPIPFSADTPNYDLQVPTPS
ncbi:ABC transporter permease, partial [Pseudomonas putida]